MFYSQQINSRLRRKEAAVSKITKRVLYEIQVSQTCSCSIEEGKLQVY